MGPAITSLTDNELRQLVALLATATSATLSPLSMDRAAADIDAIGAELWRRTHGGATETMAPPS